MKKFICGISLMMALMAAPAVAMAGNAPQQQCEKANKECVKGENGEKKCCKGEKKCKKGKKFGEFKGECGRKGPKMNKGNFRAKLFQGITLSEAQQQKLATLDNKMKSDRQEFKAKMRAEKQKMMEKAAKDGEKVRADYDNALKDILTPEQFATYEANQKAIATKRAEKRAAKDAKKAAKRAMRENLQP